MSSTNIYSDKRSDYNYGCSSCGYGGDYDSWNGDFRHYRDQSKKYKEHLNYCEKLNELRTSQKYCDVVIQVEDRTFFCHKIILAASSEYFDAMLGADFQERKQDHINLNMASMVSAKTFETILSFMYCRQLQVQRENATDLFLASDFLGIDFVRRLSFNYIRNHYHTLPTENVLEVFVVIVNINKFNFHFIDDMWMYLADNSSMLHRTSLFGDFSYLALNSILEIIDYESNGDEIVKAIMHWVNYKLDERKGLLPEIIEMIKFGITDAPYLKVLEKFAVDCNKPEMISNTQLVPSISNALAKGLSTSLLGNFPYRSVSPLSPSNAISNSLLHLFFTYIGPYSSSTSDYFGILALDHKLQWKCYSRKSDIVYIDTDNETDYINIWLDYEDPVFSMRTVIGENLYHFIPCGSAFFRSNSTNTNKQICLKYPTASEDSATSLCSLQDKVYLSYIPFARERKYNLKGFLKDSNFSADKLTGSITVYQCELDEWFPVPPPPPWVATKNSILVSCENSLYLLGAPPGNSSTSGACRYDSRTPQWEMLPSMCYKNKSPAACECNGRIYVCSGNSKQVECYDPVANKWDKIARKKKMSEERNKDPYFIDRQRYFELVCHNDRVWVVDKYAGRSVEVYDPKNNCWSNFNPPDVAMRRWTDDERGHYWVDGLLSITSS